MSPNQKAPGNTGNKKTHSRRSARTAQAAERTGAEGMTNATSASRLARRNSVARVLDAIFGEPADSTPSLWDLRAYLMIVGLVYERLAAEDTEVPTSELVSLAKALTEARHVNAAVSSPAPRSGDGSGDAIGAKPLSGGLARAVRTVYGTRSSACEDGAAAGTDEPVGGADTVVGKSTGVTS